MSLISDLHARLVADSAIAADAGARVYDLRAPQSPTQPYVVLTEISSARYPHTLASGGIVAKRVQIDCYAANTTTVRRLAENIRLRIDGFRGTMGATDVRSCFCDGDADAYEPPTDGRSSGTCRKILEFMISHAETVPSF